MVDGVIEVPVRAFGKVGWGDHSVNDMHAFQATPGYHRKVRTSSLFSAERDEDFDPEYVAIRDSKRWVDIRNRLEAQWRRFHPHADANFLKEIRTNGHFNSRVWEMRLACAFLDAGRSLMSSGSGPDLIVDGVLVEAVAPQPCIAIKETAHEMRKGEFVSACDDEMVLRFTSAISEKRRQYQRWVKKGIIDPTSPFVIAVSASNFGPGVLDPSDPIVLWPLLGVRGRVAMFDHDGNAQSIQFAFQPTREKPSGAHVDNFLFREGGASEVSAVIFSDRNFRTASFDDIVTIHNPRAAFPLAERFLPFGREFAVRGDSIVQLEKD